MNFKPHRDLSGTSYQGEFEATYDELVELFGAPINGPDSSLDDKVTCNWGIKFADGTIATIYDWKESSTPRGVYSWHVGGTSPRATQLVIQEWESNHF
jgi:hypothetical protein